MQNIDIFLITYNRLNLLKRTMDQILSDSSPIKDYSITIIDNNSTDGTYDYLLELQKNNTNLEVIKNIRNIGGNANICRAYEFSLTKPAEYIWVLCDDDLYDFTDWWQVEKEIQKKTDVICVSNYALTHENFNKTPLNELLLQMTFVPAGIYKKALFTDEVITNMYDSIITMFQQLVVFMEAVNSRKKIKIIQNEIVHNGVFYPSEEEKTDYSYTRGSRKTLKRRKDTNWILGFANVITLLDSEKLRQDAMKFALNSKCIFLHGINDFFNAMIREFVHNDEEHYLEEIKYVVNDEYKILINEKIIEFENLEKKQHKIFYHREKKFKEKIKLFIKNNFPIVFSILKRIKNKIWK